MMTLLCIFLVEGVEIINTHRLYFYLQNTRAVSGPSKFEKKLNRDKTSELTLKNLKSFFCDETN